MLRGEGGREREEGEGGISGCGIGSLGYLGNHIKVWVGWLPAVRNPPIVASASGQWDLFRPRRGRPWRSLPDRITAPGAMKMPLHWIAEEVANWEKTLSVTMDRSSIVGCSIIFFSFQSLSFELMVSWIVDGNSMIFRRYFSDRIMIMKRCVHLYRLRFITNFSNQKNRWRKCILFWK